jgi:hypothetical protein
MKRSTTLFSLCLLLTHAKMVLSQTLPATQPAARPAYTFVRYDENFSFLKDPEQHTDPFDTIKYMPFNEAGDIYLSLGGQVRDRYEFFDKNTFGGGIQDGNGYNLLRVMANADLHIGPNLRFFIQGISATEQDRDGGPRASDVDDGGMHQAFAELDLPIGDASSFALRVGRQNLLFGAQRLIGPLDWTNVRRTFDAVRGTFTFGTNQLDLFYAMPIQPAKYDWDDEINGTRFAGIYDTWKLPGAFAKGKNQIEAYGLFVNRNSITFPSGGTHGESRYTVGTRFSGNPKPFDYDVEADYQFGRFNARDINAFSVASVIGVTAFEAPIATRPYLGFDIASGDRKPTDGQVETFDQLFPTGHTFFGYIDVIGRQNIIDLHPGIEFTVLKDRQFARKLSFSTEYHVFWRESDRDAVYNAAGTVLRADATNRSTVIGNELDLLLNWQVETHTSFYAGYSHFFPGSFINQTGSHQAIDFAYGAVAFTF